MQVREFLSPRSSLPCKVKALASFYFMWHRKKVITEYLLFNFKSNINVTGRKGFCILKLSTQKIMKWYMKQLKKHVRIQYCSTWVRISPFNLCFRSNIITWLWYGIGDSVIAAWIATPANWNWHLIQIFNLRMLAG